MKRKMKILGDVVTDDPDGVRSTAERSLSLRFFLSPEEFIAGTSGEVESILCTRYSVPFPVEF